MWTARALVLLTALVGTRMPSVDDAFVRHGPAIVGVRAGPAGAEVDTTGFFLTSSGLIATVMLPAETATVTLPGGAVRKARVVARVGARNASTSALVTDGALTLLSIERASDDDVFAALAVRRTTSPKKKPPTWWLALTFTDGRALPALGGLRKIEKGEPDARLRLDVPAGPGAPVLIDDEVVAVVVQRVDQTSCVAVDVNALVELARTVTPPPAPPPVPGPHPTPASPR